MPQPPRPDPIAPQARRTASLILLTLCIAAAAIAYSGRSAPALKAAPTFAVNINTADAATLELLPRIGPALARRIIEHRAAHGPYGALGDLDRVPGIGSATLERLRPHITFGAGESRPPHR